MSALLSIITAVYPPIAAMAGIAAGDINETIHLGSKTGAALSAPYRIASPVEGSYPVLIIKVLLQHPDCGNSWDKTMFGNKSSRKSIFFIG